MGDRNSADPTNRVSLRIVVDDRWTSRDFEVLLESLQELYGSYAALYSEPSAISTRWSDKGVALSHRQTVLETLQPMTVQSLKYGSLGDVTMGGVGDLLVACAKFVAIAVLAGAALEKAQEDTRYRRAEVREQTAKALSAEESVRHQVAMNRIEEELASQELAVSKKSIDAAQTTRLVKEAAPLAEEVRGERRRQKRRASAQVRSQIESSPVHEEAVRVATEAGLPGDLAVSRLLTAPAARIGVLAREGKVLRAEIIRDGRVVDPLTMNDVSDASEKSETDA